MNINTGEIKEFLKDTPNAEMSKKGFVPLTEDEALLLATKEKKYRKNYMRNILCPCGSHKKFKKCCWDKAK